MCIRDRKKVCYKVTLCKNCQRQSCKAFIGLTIRAKMIARCDPSTWNFGSNRPRWSKFTDFRSVFTCSASTVAFSKKCSIDTNRKSTMRFPMSPRQVWFIPLADERGVCRWNCEIPWERVPYLSALEVCSRRGAIQIHVYLPTYLPKINILRCL